jgi:hypothetical protein
LHVFYAVDLERNLQELSQNYPAPTTTMVKELWEEIERRRGIPHQNEGGPLGTIVKEEGEGEEPPEPPVD